MIVQPIMILWWQEQPCNQDYMLVKTGTSYTDLIPKFVHICIATVLYIKDVLSVGLSEGQCSFRFIYIAFLINWFISLVVKWLYDKLQGPEISSACYSRLRHMLMMLLPKHQRQGKIILLMIHDERGDGCQKFISFNWLTIN